MTDEAKSSRNVKARKIGAHVSAAGGVENAVTRAVEIGANCLQVFSGSPRVWARKDLSELNFQKFYSESDKNNVSPVFTHALYLVNLASDKPELLTKSKNAIIYDLEFDSKLKGAGVVVHLGSHLGKGWDVVKENVRDVIIEILKATPEASTLLIENSAGQKGKLCSDLSEIKWLVEEVEQADKSFRPRLGWCFDTCHGHAAGLKLDQVVDQIEELGLLGDLECIHVNDSRDEFDSGRDRHENIGDGEISQDELKAFLQDERIKDVPIITEVPGLDGEGPDKENIDRIKALAT